MRLAALMIALGIGLSAFGAHALRGKLSDYSMAIYEKAGFYQFTQSIALLVLAAIASSEVVNKSVALKAANLLFVGIFIFCASLYLLALSGESWLGAITPLGGATMICAWMYFAFAGCAKNT